MIAANDLRIGNWVMYDNRYFQIDSIATVFPTLNTTEFGIGVVDWNNISGIPLTEKILLDCGFDTNGIHIFKEFNPRMVLYFNNGNHAEMDLIQDGKSISFKYSHIKYLHELQNLFYSLTKTELTINL